MTRGSGQITVVGAGVSGLATAIGLAKSGIAVQLVDGRTSLGQLISGRPSINLTLGTRGFEALAQLGLADDARRAGAAAHVRRIHPADEDAVIRPYGTAGEAIVSIRRHELVGLLLDRAVSSGLVDLRLGEQVAEAAPDGTLEVQTSAGVKSLTSEVVIGADGLNSVVRRAICATAGTTGATPVDAGCRWIELSIPAQARGSHPTAVDVWPRDPLMLIGFPNRDGATTVLMFAPDGSEFPDYRSLQVLVPDLTVTAESYATALNRQDRIRTVRTPVWSAGRMFLIGDAAHAITPYLGQGANAALVDAVTVMDLVDAGVGWLELGTQFVDQRQAEMACLARLADEHYAELSRGMSDLRGTLRHDLRLLLARHDAHRFQPIYNRVAFSRGSFLAAEKEYAAEEAAIAPLADAALALIQHEERL